MAFDFKKEYKEFYTPPKTPGIIEVPPMNYLAIRGKGNPNEEDGEYNKALELLYGMAYTIKMSYIGPHKIGGFFEYIVPPLEGFWWQDGIIALLENYGGIRVGEITKRTNLSRPAVSHHLRVLKDAGIISMFKQGTMNFYHVDANESQWGPLATLMEHINDLVKDVSEK